jgi:Inositol monophosphatase family
LHIRCPYLLAHWARNADGQTRMLLAAMRGEVASQYPCGDAQQAADIEVIRAAHPADAVTGEENGSTGPDVAERRWLVDPLCGTHNYAARSMLAAVNVALRSGPASPPPVAPTLSPARSSGPTAPAPAFAATARSGRSRVRVAVGAHFQAPGAAVVAHARHPGPGGAPAAGL